MKTTKMVGTVESFIECDELGRAIKAIEKILTKLRGPDFGTSLISNLFKRWIQQYCHLIKRALSFSETSFCGEAVEMDSKLKVKTYL